ncbi:MAG: RNase adapter RapZ, partial [Gammaproteobacteria bacterium]|nr:RNase adapter RapZ [Gammaproteobacteria bacterium]
AEVVKAAIGIDARNLSALSTYPKLLTELSELGFDCLTLFLQASKATLLNRFNETRRRHPLSLSDLNLDQALELERQRLEPIAVAADQNLDTSQYNLYQLRDLIASVAGASASGPTLSLQSFGYKHGTPLDADLVFDARCLPNPNWVPELKELTGREAAVAEFLCKDPLVNRMYNQIRDYLEEWLPHYAKGGRGYINISVGCTGGRHRSVYLTERLKAHFQEKEWPVICQHRQLPSTPH